MNTCSICDYCTQWYSSLPRVYIDGELHMDVIICRDCINNLINKSTVIFKPEPCGEDSCTHTAVRNCTCCTKFLCERHTLAFAASRGCKSCCDAYVEQQRMPPEKLLANLKEKK